MSNTEELKKIRDEIVVLKESPLYAFRVKNNYYPVIGQGSHEAAVMFVGEGPGENEAKTGVPFCGAAGRVLDELLAHVGIPRNDVYITNIIKDRPPGNRDPLPEEIAVYAPFLDRQIEILRPKVIVTLGRFSMAYILEKFHCLEAIESISRLHGSPIQAEASYGRVTIVPLYHPAVGIYKASMKDVLKKDIGVLRKLLDDAT